MPGPAAVVALEDVFAVVRARKVPLAPELAGYLVLEIAEAASAGGDVDLTTVTISDEGHVSLRTKAGGDAEGTARQLLAQLLEAGASSTPALSSTARRRPVGMSAFIEELEGALIPVNRAAGRRALARLAREVKRAGAAGEPGLPSPPVPPPPLSAPAAPLRSQRVPPPVRPSASPAIRKVVDAPPRDLMPSEPPTGKVPIAATKKPLMFDRSEVDNLLEQFEMSTTEEERTVARQLRNLVGVDPTPPPPLPSPPPAPSPSMEETGVESLLAMSEPVQTIPDRSQDAIPVPVPSPYPAEVKADSRAPAEPIQRINVRDAAQKPATGEKAAPPPAPAATPRREKGSGLGVFLVLLVVFGGGAGALWVWKPEMLLGRSAGPKPSSPTASASASPPVTAPPPAVSSAPQLTASAPTGSAAEAACRATILVSDVPADAEVLLRMGQAPLDVDRMPVGARLEFVVTAEGHATKRGVVRAGAKWAAGPDNRPRYELPVQLDPLKKAAQDAWPTAEGGEELGGPGAAGVVHIVSDPPGAEVWLVTGFGPEARLEQIRCGSDVDLLVGGPTTRKRMTVAAKDVADAPQAPGAPGGTRLVQVSAKEKR